MHHNIKTLTPIYDPLKQETYLWPLEIENRQPPTNCINIDGKIHQNTEG